MIQDTFSESAIKGPLGNNYIYNQLCVGVSAEILNGR